MANHGAHNEGTYHNWFSKELDLEKFNRSVIDEHGGGDHFTIFDPSFLNKSGKQTPGIGRFWSGQAGAVKRGIEIGSFVVGDLVNRTAFHLGAELTPNPKELAAKGTNLMEHYVGLVTKRKDDIKHFGNCLAADGYFGVNTFVEPVIKLGICVVSCLKSNAALFYIPPQVQGKRNHGRPRKKDGKIDWANLDENRLPIVMQDETAKVRSAIVYVKCLKRQVRLVAVDYLKEDGSLQTRKLFFCTDIERDFDWVMERYHGRFWIEFIFRDAKQFTGLTHCQSTDAKKLKNHVNLSLTAVSVAKAAHWLPINEEKRGPFSMAELKAYYYNLSMVKRISEALGIDPTETKNNPKIK